MKCLDISANSREKWRICLNRQNLPLFAIRLHNLSPFYEYVSQKQGLHPFILDTAPAILIQDLDLAVKIYLCLQLLIIGGRVCKSLRKTRKSAAFVRFFSSVCQAQISLGPLAFCIEAWKPPVLGTPVCTNVDEFSAYPAKTSLNRVYPNFTHLPS